MFNVIEQISQLFKNFKGRQKFLKDTKRFSRNKDITSFDSKFKQSH